MAIRDRVLAHQGAYHWFKAAIGAQRTMEVIARDYVRAKPGQSLLDIGCGDGDIRPLFAGVDYTGVDFNADYIRVARRMEDDHTRFEVGDITALSGIDRVSAERYDLCYAFGVLHHLSNAEADAMLRSARGLLRPGGRLITVDAVFDPDQSTVARVLAATDRGRYVRDEWGYRALLEQVFGPCDLTIRTDLLRIPYSHCITECWNDPPSPDRRSA
jgi:SAM-dependent methyltransferase